MYVFLQAKLEELKALDEQISDISGNLDDLSTQFGTEKAKPIAKDVAAAQTKLDAMTQKAMKVSFCDEKAT